MNATQSATQPQNQTENEAPLGELERKLARPDFGNGRYSPMLNECFDACQTILELNATEAEKVARKIASDFGAYMSSKGIGLDKVRIGKANKDNKVTLKEAGQSVKGVTLTWALFVLKGLLFAAEAGTNGFLYGGTNGTQWKKTETMEKCIFNILNPPKKGAGDKADESDEG